MVPSDDIGAVGLPAMVSWLDSLGFRLWLIEWDGIVSVFIRVNDELANPDAIFISA